jgi:hypothetical protein
MSDLELKLLEAGLNLLVALVVLGLGWFIGQRLTLKWNLIQKQRETDITNLQEFYSLYGEFKEVSKVWRILKRKKKDSSLVVPLEDRWSLLNRACAVESKNEAILVKLATERNLETSALNDLGLFRQAFQQLRESIRDDKEVPSASRGPEYVFFNNLAAKVGLIISSSSPDSLSDPKRATERLKTIVNVRLPDYRRAIKDFTESHPEYNEKDINYSD